MTLIICTLSFVIAQVIGAPEMVTVFTPGFVYLGTLLAKYLLPKVPGFVVLYFIVPGISMLMVYLSSLLADDNINFWYKVIWGLFAVILDQVVKQAPAKKAV